MAPFLSPPNFRGEPKKGGHTHSTKCHVQAVFFFSQLKNSAHEKFFCPFFRFFYKRKPFSRPLLGQMFIFCTPTFVFHGYFLVFFWIFSRGTNEFSQAETVCLQGDFVQFYGHLFEFHGHTFRKIFTGSFRGFFKFFHGHLFFYGHKFPFLSRVKFDFTREKKKHCVLVYVYVILRKRSFRNSQCMLCILEACFDLFSREVFWFLIREGGGNRQIQPC